MRSSLAAVGFALLVPCFANSQPSRTVGTHPQELPSGKLLPRVQCTAHPEQSYALYLPSNYSTDRRWPLVISSDPGARAAMPLALQKDAADKFGYVLASSYNSRNGPWKPLFEATGAMLTDLQMRISIDVKRVYFVGFSGGARASAQFASLCKCSAGVVLSGAGFPAGLQPGPDTRFPVFSTVGTVDFNYGEVIRLQDTLAQAGYPHWLRVFEGSHEWAPAAVMEEAFAWLRIQAIKAQLEARDQAFVDAQFSKAQTRAQSFEQAGDLLAAWREYLQIAATFDSLVDVTPLRERAESLGREKAVRDALKRERNEFSEQASMTANINAAVAGPDSLRDDSHDPAQEISRLRQLAYSEKKPEKARVYRRALAEVFIRAMEAGLDFVESKSYDRAVQAFDAAIQASPDSEWAWQRLAVANAYAGKPKQALAALRQARRVSSDLSSFSDWLKTEPAFQPLRSTPEFQALQASKQ